MKIMRNRRIRSITLNLINQKLGNNSAVFDIYLPFVAIFDLMAITRMTPTIESLRYEMVYVTKLLEIHQRRGCKEIPIDFGVGNCI